MAELAASAMAASGAAAAGSAATAGSAAAASSIGSWLAGTTVTTAAGATTALAAPTSTALTALQGGLTLASMASSLMGGAMAYRQSKDQAMFADIDANGAAIAAEEKATRIRREELQRIAATRVAYAASGVDIASAAPTEDAIASQSDFEQGLALDSGAIAKSRGLAAAQQIRSQGTSRLVSAASKALGSKLDDKIDIARRG